jgi:Mce-associated membrane protein
MSQQTAPTTASRRKIAGERVRRTVASGPAGAVGSLGADVEPVDDGVPARPWLRSLVRRRIVPGWLLLGLAALTAAVLVFDGVTWARSGAAYESTAASLAPDSLNAASAQAEKAATQILSYDYADLKADTTAAAGYMTPAYARTFQRTVDDLLADAAAEQRGVVAAKVMASGVVSAGSEGADGTGKVEVLLFVDQTSRTKPSKTPQTALNRVVFTMVDEDGRWLVDDVAAL